MNTVVSIGHFIALVGKLPDCNLSFIPQYLSNSSICRTKVSAATSARHGKREWRVWMPLQKCSTIPEPFQLLTVHYAVFLIRTVIQMTPSDPSGLTVVLCTIICQPADCCCLPTVISYIRPLPYNKKMITSNTQVCGFQFTEEAEGPDYSKVVWKIIVRRTSHA